jgi:hypothetical protein
MKASCYCGVGDPAFLSQLILLRLVSVCVHRVECVSIGLSSNALFQSLSTSLPCTSSLPSASPGRCCSQPSAPLSALDPGSLRWIIESFLPAVPSHVAPRGL